LREQCGYGNRANNPIAAFFILRNLQGKLIIGNLAGVPDNSGNTNRKDHQHFFLPMDPDFINVHSGIILYAEAKQGYILKCEIISFLKFVSTEMLFFVEMKNFSFFYNF
jgi:hypothetical protein